MAVLCLNIIFQKLSEAIFSLYCFVKPTERIVKMPGSNNLGHCPGLMDRKGQVRYKMVSAV